MIDYSLPLAKMTPLAIGDSDPVCRTDSVHEVMGLIRLKREREIGDHHDRKVG
jgi:hypothetical protein